MKFSTLWVKHGILQDVLSAKYHTQYDKSLKQQECGRDFGDDGFFIDSSDNKPLCKSCKHVKLIRQVEKIRA